MEEQACLSQLALGSDSKPPQWSTDGCPRLLGGWRQAHASIVIAEGKKERIIVLGGWTENDVNDSVLVMNTAEKQFRQGPSMSEGRYFFAARKVNIGVYACGGINKSNKYSHTIERIDVNHLFEAPKTSTTGKWKTLPCRLTAPRGGCTACDVYNRYLVIVGGYNGSTYLSSVDVLDTGRDGNHHTIVAGINMNCVRCQATSEVIGTHMFVVGGTGGNGSVLWNTLSLVAVTAATMSSMCFKQTLAGPLTMILLFLKNEMILLFSMEWIWQKLDGFWLLQVEVLHALLRYWIRTVASFGVFRV